MKVIDKHDQGDDYVNRNTKSVNLDDFMNDLLLQLDVGYHGFHVIYAAR